MEEWKSSELSDAIDNPDDMLLRKGFTVIKVNLLIMILGTLKMAAYNCFSYQRVLKKNVITSWKSIVKIFRRIHQFLFSNKWCLNVTRPRRRDLCTFYLL